MANYSSLLFWYILCLKKSAAWIMAWQEAIEFTCKVSSRVPGKLSVQLSHLGGRSQRLLKIVVVLFTWSYNFEQQLPKPTAFCVRFFTTWSLHNSGKQKCSLWLLQQSLTYVFSNTVWNETRQNSQRALFLVLLLMYAYFSRGPVKASHMPDKLFCHWAMSMTL